MCGNATLATDVSSTSINVASITETAINQGLKLGRQASIGCIAARVAAGSLFDSLLIDSASEQWRDILGKWFHAKTLGHRPAGRARALFTGSLSRLASAPLRETPFNLKGLISRSLNPDFRLDRHAGADRVLRIRLLVEDDLHRHALHNFDIIAGSVFRRQHAEARAGAGLYAVDMAFEDRARIRIHL